MLLLLPLPVAAMVYNKLTSCGCPTLHVDLFVMSVMVYRWNFGDLQIAAAAASPALLMSALLLLPPWAPAPTLATAIKQQFKMKVADGGALEPEA